MRIDEIDVCIRAVDDASARLERSLNNHPGIELLRLALASINAAGAYLYLIPDRDQDV